MFMIPTLRLCFRSHEFSTKYEYDNLCAALILYKSLKSRPEIIIEFHSLEARLSFLEDLVTASRSEFQGITFAMISLGTRSSTYIHEEQELICLLSEAERHLWSVREYSPFSVYSNYDEELDQQLKKRGVVEVDCGSLVPFFS